MDLKSIDQLRTLYYEIADMINKKGEPYKVLKLYYCTDDGELILVHDVYLRESLESIFKVLEKLNPGHK